MEVEVQLHASAALGGPKFSTYVLEKKRILPENQAV